MTTLASQMVFLSFRTDKTNTLKLPATSIILTTSFDENPNNSRGFSQLREEHDRNLPKHSLPSSFDENRSKSSGFSQFLEEQDRKFPSPFDDNPQKSSGFSKFLEEQDGKFPSPFDQNPYKSSGFSQFLEGQDRKFPSPFDDNPTFSHLLEEQDRNIPNFHFHVQQDQHNSLSSSFFFEENPSKSSGFSNLLEEPDMKLQPSFDDDPNMSSRFSQQSDEQDINFPSFAFQFQPDYYLSLFFNNNPRNSGDGFSQILEEQDRNLPNVVVHVEPTKHYPSSSFDHNSSESNEFSQFPDTPTLNGFEVSFGAHWDGCDYSMQQPETIEEVQNGCCFSAENSVAIKTESSASGQKLIFSHDETPSKLPSSANHSNYQTQTQQCDDGYKWRKYGQKQVKGTQNPRSYYKCAYPNCPSKKKVENSLANGEITRILYRGTHNHVKPLSNKRPNATSSAYSAISALNPVKVEISDHHQSVSNYVNGTHEISSSSAAIMVDDEHDAWKMGVKENNLDETPRIAIQTASEIDHVNDGYRWRKYGQKLVKGNPNPRIDQLFGDANRLTMCPPTLFNKTGESSSMSCAVEMKLDMVPKRARTQT